MGASRDRFHWADYVVFAGMLAASIGIGIYQSCVGGKQKTQGEYFMGDRNLHPVPVGLSMLMSFMSAILILGATAEMYTAGTQWFMYGPGICLIVVLVSLIFVPLLYPLKLTSANEYLELRFKSKATRLIGTFLLITSQLLYMGVATFSPATALEAVTGIPVWVSILCVGGVSTIYTTLGGMKAVIWTDVFQAGVMVSGLIAICIVGSLEVGGISEVWRINDEWGRIIFFDMDPDPTSKHTFWTTFVGGGISFLGVYGVNQVAVQRYCALPTLTKARLAVAVNIPGLLCLFAVTCLTGVVVFAYFTKEGCDPLKNKDIGNANQLLPFFMMRVLAYPGVPGLFVASLFAGALSTMSSSLSALSAATWEDMMKWKFGHLPESRKTMITKILVFVYGAIGVAMAFCSQFMGGTVIRAAISFYLTSMAPLLGLFLLGSIFAWANWIGAIVGALTGLCLVMWIAIGSYTLQLASSALPTAVSNCTNYSPTTSNTTTADELHGVQRLYTISYLWNPTIGITTTIVVGLLVSLITGPTKSSEVDRKYVLPICDWLFCCLPESCRKKFRCGTEGLDDEVKETEEHKMNGVSNAAFPTHEVEPQDVNVRL